MVKLIPHISNNLSAKNITIKIESYKKDNKIILSANETAGIKNKICDLIQDIPLNINQRFLVKYNEEYYNIIIEEITPKYSKFYEGIELTFIGSCIKSIKNENTDLFIPNWNFEQMGIGGLSKEFDNIFRRVFSSRLYSNEENKNMVLKHIKGLLLYLFSLPDTW